MRLTHFKQKASPVCIALLGLILHKNALGEEYFNALPPPETLQPNFVPEYYASIMLNGRDLENRIPVRIVEHHFLVPRFYLKQTIPVPASQLPSDNRQFVDITSISGVKTHYDDNKHVLVIDVPSSWLPKQTLSATGAAQNISYSRSSGLALDYDVYVSRNRLLDSGTLYLGGRFFTGSGYLFASGMASRYTLRGSDLSDTRYIRYLTYYRQYFADNDTALILGDFISDGGVWDSGVRMGGLSFRKEFQLSPDKNIYQSPSIRGTARTPSIVDIFMDNRKIASDSVNSGPYEINNLPFINGSGQVTVVTTDKLGNKTNETVQLYKSNSLLAAGVNQYSANLGYLRYNYGYRDSKYRNLAFSGYMNRGITPVLTHSLFLQTARNLLMTGSGITYLAAPFGTFSITGAISSDNESSRHSGGRAELSYSYANQHVNLSYNHSQYTRGYTDLGSYGYHDNDYLMTPTRSVDQVWLSYQWQNAVTLGAGYFYIQPYTAAAYSMGNLSLSMPTFLQGQLSLGVSAYNASGRDLMTMLSWSVPLGSTARAQYTFNHSSLGNRNDMTLAWGGYGPQQTHADLQVTRDETGYRYQRASLYRSSQYANLSGGLYGYNDKTYWLEGSGTITVAGRAVQLNRESQGAFVLVNTGIPNLPYYSGGNLQGYTDSRGYGFIDNVQAGTPVEISVDPTYLPAEYYAARYRQKVRLYPQSGTEVNFGGVKAFPANFRLVDNAGHPLPTGSVMKDENTGNSTFIGYNGSAFLYLDNEKPVMLSVYHGTSTTCRIVLQRRDFTSRSGTSPIYTCR